VAVDAATASTGVTLKDNIRFAVLGAGNAVGPYLAAVVDQVEGAELVALVDLNEANLAAVCRRFPTADGFATQRDLHNSGVGVDVEVIAVPTMFHRDHIVAALREGHHVMGEKPLTANPEQTEEVLDLAQERDRHLFGIGQRRLMVEEIAQVIAAGRIGKVLSARATWLRAAATPPFALRDPRGAFADLGVHQLKMLSAALGGARVDHITGLAHHREGELGEYHAHATLLFGDVPAVIETGWTLHPAKGEGNLAPEDEVTLEVVGEKGTITTALPTYEETPEELARFRPEIITREGEVRRRAVLGLIPSVTACREREVREMVALVRDGIQPSLPVDEMNIAEAIDGFYASAQRCGQQIVC
jgi:predicted dehydrogenase